MLMLTLAIRHCSLFADAIADTIACFSSPLADAAFAAAVSPRYFDACRAATMLRQLILPDYFIFDAFLLMLPFCYAMPYSH